MTIKPCTLLVLAAVCAARPSPDHAPPHHAPAHHVPHHAPVYKAEPRPYSFSYAVADKYHGVDFGQTEHSDGKSVKGSYNVALPDGRKQTVKYDADHYKGYTADVSYYGEAQYPHASPYKPHAAPHAPTYH
ncbi:unnamed protein product [Meganyctiphanes norvegica]|uniref:Cuticle protein 8 n=1 Tax=Meganyctiphanes norvegica TaxID=48144 RepID=A0AAV2QM06_MEGNR